MLADALGINQPCVVACVGAGGKTSLVQSLAKNQQLWPVVVTSTTKMFYDQAAQYPLILLDERDAGIDMVRQKLQNNQQAAWFSRQQGEKVLGLPPGWVDKLAAALPAANVLVEADGARRCLIKAPAEREPVIPATTTITVGIVNLRVLGQPLSATNAHRPELVTRIINKLQGESITWQDIVRLAVHEHGIFQYARGNRILLLSGGGNTAARATCGQIAGYLKTTQENIDRVVVTSGFGSAMQVNEVYML
jgi:probable selenium-dependent hydroxylase accessory protein YqeC